MVEAARAEDEAVAGLLNSGYLEAGESGRRPRNYGLIGGYARAYLWSFGAMALAFAGFMLARALGLT